MADALVSGTSEGNLVQVRSLSRAPQAEKKFSAFFIACWRASWCACWRASWCASHFAGRCTKRTGNASRLLRSRCAIATQPGPSLLGCEVPLFLLVPAPLFRANVCHLAHFGHFTLNVARQVFQPFLYLSFNLIVAISSKNVGALH